MENNLESLEMKEEGRTLGDAASILTSTSGRVGYLIAWLLGVPVSVLFVIFLIRGH